MSVPLTLPQARFWLEGVCLGAVHGALVFLISFFAAGGATARVDPLMSYVSSGSHNFMG